MSATFAVVAFAVTTFAYVASVFTKVGPVTFHSFDSTACSTYLIPILGLYFSRRWADSKWSDAQSPVSGPTTIPVSPSPTSQASTEVITAVSQVSPPQLLTSVAAAVEGSVK